MLWTVPCRRKSVVVHYVVFQWLWSALTINLTLFYESPTNDSEIAVDSTCTQACHGRDTLHLNLCIQAAGSTVHIFLMAVICFFCLLKRQSLAWEDKSRRCALTKRDVLIFLEKLKLTYIHCNWIHSINVLFRWTDALYLLYIAFFKPSWFYTIYFNFISYDCQANWWFHNHVIKIKINPTFSANYFIYVSSLLGDKLLEQHFQNGQQNAYSKHQITSTGRQFTELLFYAQKSQNWLFFNLSYCTED